MVTVKTQKLTSHLILVIRLLNIRLAILVAISYKSETINEKPAKLIVLQINVLLQLLQICTIFTTTNELAEGDECPGLSLPTQTLLGKSTNEARISVCYLSIWRTCHDLLYFF